MGTRNSLRNDFIWCFAPLRASLRQQGSFIFQRSAARLNSCPDTCLLASKFLRIQKQPNVRFLGTKGIPPLRVGMTRNRVFPQPLNSCPDTKHKDWAVADYFSPAPPVVVVSLIRNCLITMIVP